MEIIKTVKTKYGIGKSMNQREIIETVETKYGNVYIVPSKRKNVYSNPKRLHKLIAKLLIEQYAKKQKPPIKRY